MHERNGFTQMNKIPKAQYSPEFRDQAVKSFNARNLTVAQAAKPLSMAKTTLLSWITADKKCERSTISKHQKPLTE